MPDATVSNEPQRYDLDTLPATDGKEGGYIMARPLPYGMKLDRRDKATRMRMEQEIGPRTGNRANRRRQRTVNDEPEIQKIDLETMNAWAFQHDCAYCVVSHNLTDKAGAPLDFKNPMTYNYLDPRVGGEIEEILAELNGDDIEADVEDFTKLRTSSTTNDSTPLRTPTGLTS